MKVLVIGAAGKTGRLVVDRALAAGHSVKALVHDTAPLADKPLSDGVQIVQGDVHDLVTVSAALIPATPSSIRWVGKHPS